MIGVLFGPLSSPKPGCTAWYDGSTLSWPQAKGYRAALVLFAIMSARPDMTPEICKLLLHGMASI